MNDKELKHLAKFTKKIGQYKPNEILKKPKHQPSIKELNEKYKLNLKKMKIDIV